MFHGEKAIFDAIFSVRLCIVKSHFAECLLCEDFSINEINAVSHSIGNKSDIRIQRGKDELQEPFPIHMTRDSPCSV